MKLKLGQLLIKEKLVSQEQLDEALKSQAIFGGRLGSYLVETGALREEQLAGILSRKYRVPFARSQHFTKLPQEVIDCVPKDLAEKYLVLPLKKEGKRLYLAMPDPGDLRAVQEISFATGRVISPVVAPETVIVKHLKRYYNIDRIGNYIIIDSPDELEAAAAPAATEPVEEWLGGPEQDAIMEEWERKVFAERETRGAKDAPRQAPAPAPQAPAAESPPVVVASLDELGRMLAKSLEREGMGDLAAGYLASEYANAALFLVRKERAIGWRAVVDRKPVEAFDHVQIDLALPSVLQTVARGKSVHLGPLPKQPGNRQLLEALGSAAPERVLVVPMVLSGRLIGLIYVENRKLDLSGLVGEVQKLANMLAIGLEILILRNKLTAM